MVTTLDTLESVRALLAEVDPNEKLVACALRDLIVGPGVLDRVVDAVLANAPLGGGRPKVALLVDTTTIVRQVSPDASATQDVKVIVADLLGAHADVTKVVLDDGHLELHVTEDVVAQAIQGAQGCSVIVALGGGTISDIGKLAAAAINHVSVVSIMTAASVDGYTDNVSVMLKDGVKRTVPSVWPQVVIADDATVAGAPARMNRAGYGEMTSMYVAPADWRLAALIGVDPSFHPGPVALLSALAADLDACAPGIGRGEPAAVARLTWALALRGIATGVAGTTACLSGVEHLISHMLDLRAASLHLPTGLHGEQVGAGSVVAACAWEMLQERLQHSESARRPAAIDDDFFDRGRARDRVDAAFAAIDPDGVIRTECWRDYARKLERLEASRAAILSVARGWSEHSATLTDLVRTSSTIASGLREAGAPAVLSDLGVDAAVARWAVENCGLMRDRVTVVDLLTALGWWGPNDVDEVFARVAAAVGSEIPS